MNWLARIGALLLLLIPAVASAQVGQKAYVGEGGGSAATSNVPPPSSSDSTTSAGGALSKTYSATKNIVDTGMSLAPSQIIDGKAVPIDPNVTKVTDGMKTGSNIIKTTKVLSSGYDAVREGDYAKAGSDIAKAAAAEAIDQCVDKGIAFACAAVTTPAGALPCTAAVKLVKFCAETIAGKSIGQAVVSRTEEYIEDDSATTNGETVSSTNWSDSRKDYVDYTSKQAPASSQQAGCHPGHNESAHPGGCFDYTR